MNPTLSIVVVRLRPAEIGHHTIAEVLGDSAAVALDRLCRSVMVIRDDFAPPFGIEMTCDLGRADEIAEKNGQMTPLTASGFSRFRYSNSGSRHNGNSCR